MRVSPKREADVRKLVDKMEYPNMKSTRLFIFALAVAGDGALPISLAIKNKFKDCVKECVCKHCIVGWVI